MAAQPEKYRKLGPLDLTLVPRDRLPGRADRASTALEFEGTRCARGRRGSRRRRRCRGRHPVVLEGEYAAWREMVENIRAHGGADLTHTLNYLTLPDWPLRLVPVDEEQGQLDVDRFYRYNETPAGVLRRGRAASTRGSREGG